MDVQLFFMLLGGHYLADYGLQSRFMADAKERATKDAVGFFALVGHAAIHGLVAGLLSQRLSVGLIIAGTHWVIDFLKAVKRLYGITVDQGLHILVILLVVLFVV
jgi:hypothetical protein